jgi:hypothetical protein
LRAESAPFLPHSTSFPSLPELPDDSSPSDRPAWLILTVKLDLGCGTTLPRPKAVPGITVHPAIIKFRVDFRATLANSATVR